MPKYLTMLMLLALLSGCAAMNRLSSEVSSFGAWPGASTAPAFVFDRQPSVAQPQQQMLESAALPALAAAGFKQASSTAAADFVVQLGASVNVDSRLADDFYFHAPFGLQPGWRHLQFGIGAGFGWGYGRFGGPFATPLYVRQVVVLIRDRPSGQTVYETRASNSGASPAINSLLPAMFEAAMAGFPRADATQRQVVTEIQ